MSKFVWLLHILPNVKTRYGKEVGKDNFLVYNKDVSYDFKIYSIKYI